MLRLPCRCKLCAPPCPKPRITGEDYCAPCYDGYHLWAEAPCGSPFHYDALDPCPCAGDVGE